ncbi:hypothetical protein T484DRAFT_1805540 [Baffinella frigidus]|nr:hypothetical protein T484DRAFT_1805540 [Cryptophyta sp. CCMP2293]
MSTRVVIVPNGAAGKCGKIRVNDALLTIDGKRVTSIADAKALIVGEHGSFIALGLQRANVGEFTLTIARGTGELAPGSGGHSEHSGGAGAAGGRTAGMDADPAPGREQLKEEREREREEEEEEEEEKEKSLKEKEQSLEGKEEEKKSLRGLAMRFLSAGRDGSGGTDSDKLTSAEDETEPPAAAGGIEDAERLRPLQQSNTVSAIVE